MRRSMARSLLLRLAAPLVAGGMALGALALPAGAALAAGTTTTCTQTAQSTTCTTTAGSGSVLGTCTVTGAPYCTPAASGGSGAAASGSGGGSDQVTSNLNTLKGELTPDIGSVFSNPVTAPLVRLGLFALSCLAVWYLGAALVDLMVRVRQQARGEGISHQNLHGPLFAVGVLLLIVAGGGIWLLTGAVQGLQALMHG